MWWAENVTFSAADLFRADGINDNDPLPSIVLKKQMICAAALRKGMKERQIFAYRSGWAGTSEDSVHNSDIGKAGPVHQRFT